MPSGIVHDTVNLTFIILASLLYFFLPPEYYLPFLCGYMFSTFFLSPDLDLSYSRIAKRWGIFKIFFYPYFFLSTHRGLSHALIIGTLIRYLYIILIGIFIYIGYKFFTAHKFPSFINNTSYFFDFAIKYKNYLIFFLLGGVVADSIHIILDRISTYEKKKYKRMTYVKSNK